MGSNDGGFQRRNEEDGQGQEVFPYGNTGGQLEVDAPPLSGGAGSTPPGEAELPEDAPAQATSFPDTDAHPGPAQPEAAAAAESSPPADDASLPPSGCDQAPQGQQAPHPTDCDGQADEVQAKPSWPKDYLSAEEERFIERPTSAAHASYQRPAYFAELDTNTAEVVVQAGDHIECAGSFKDLRLALTEHYDIRGPIETLLLERLLELHWRLRRVHAIERGIIEKQTIGLKSQRMVARIKAAKKADHFALMGKENPFASTNPYIVQFAREKVDELVLLLKDGVDDFKAIFKDLGDAMGRDHEQMPHNVGGAVAWLIFAAPKHGVSSEQIRTQLVEILGELVENLGQHEKWLLEDMAKTDEAEVQSLRGVTDPQRLRALSAMERGLQGQMLEVLSELERRVRWRRVVEALANK